MQAWINEHLAHLMADPPAGTMQEGLDAAERLHKAASLALEVCYLLFSTETRFTRYYVESQMTPAGTTQEGLDAAQRLHKAASLALEVVLFPFFKELVHDHLRHHYKEVCLYSSAY
jgi:hypothetical protein